MRGEKQELQVQQAERRREQEKMSQKTNEEETWTTDRRVKKRKEWGRGPEGTDKWDSRENGEQDDRHWARGQVRMQRTGEQATYGPQEAGEVRLCVGACAWRLESAIDLFSLINPCVFNLSLSQTDTLTLIVGGRVSVVETREMAGRAAMDEWKRRGSDPGPLHGHAGTT